MIESAKIEEAVAIAEELPAAKREAWLVEFCGGDKALRTEIASLLKFEAQAEQFLEVPFDAQARAILEGNPGAGRSFGNYEIEREIGHGGMGAVYLAHRTDGEFDQQVALKIVRGSVADSRMIERFKQERQILASLNHPNIARLLDGGVSSSGEPFLAMEYIQGEAITDFVERAGLPIEGILSLFLKVCSAVSYAHRNLVVHRDIKPENIMVTVEGEPKLLDFGVAKLTGGTLAAEADATETAFRVLTPAYASPEQFLSHPITTSSDIYSLGVLLYELLTGVRPFNFEKKSLHQIVATVTTIDPPAPSAVAGRGPTGADNPDRLAHPSSRGSKAVFTSKLRGDLDTIVLMALRKETQRRYSSVAEFADDIDRYLKGIPVAARPHTKRYRAGKFLMRHRLGVASGVIILTALLAGVALSLWQAQRARLEKTKAEAVSQFLQTMLSASAPNNGFKQQGGDLTVKAVLDDASERLAAQNLSDQPEVRATLQRIIGASYLSIGQYDLADQNLNAAHEAQIALYGEDNEETLRTLVLVASLWVARGENERANQHYKKRISILRTAYQSGGVEADFLVQALYDYAMVVRAQGDSRAAETILREALELGGKASVTGRPSEGVILPVLALTLADQGRFEEAEGIIRAEINEIIERGGGADAPDLATNLTGLGAFQMEQGKHADAEANLKSAEAIYRKHHAPAFLALGDNVRLQAQNQYLQGRYAEAEDKIAEALNIYRASTSPQYVNYPTALMIQGLIFTQTQRSAAAEEILREAVRIRSENLPAAHYLSALTKGALGECLTTRKNFIEAEILLKESLANLISTQGAESPRTLLARNRLAVLYQKLE